MVTKTKFPISQDKRRSSGISASIISRIDEKRECKNNFYTPKTTFTYRIATFTMPKQLYTRALIFKTSSKDNMVASFGNSIQRTLGNLACRSSKIGNSCAVVSLLGKTARQIYKV